MKALLNACFLGANINLLYDGSKIIAMMPAMHDLPTDLEESFDACGLLLFPSFTDAHVHLREPGQEYKEDINTGLTSAAHGGFANIMCMANTSPVNDNAAITTYIKDKALKTHPDGPRLYPIAAATINLAGEELSPLGELAEAGCIAVSNDGKPVKSTEMVRRIMEYANDFGMKFIDHCEDPWLAKGWMMNEGSLSCDMGVKGQPGCGEAIQVARDLLLAEYLNIPVHLAHISSRPSVDLIRWGKERGIKVTAETCPHYLLLDENSLKNYNTNAKMSPPLRTQEDQSALIDALKSGVIDILVTDHAPHAQHEKDTTLDNAPFGIIGLDLALSLTFQLVKNNTFSENELINFWAKCPAKIFNVPINKFNPGDPADFFLYNPDLEWKVSSETLFSKSSNTPFLNKTLTGKVIHHWINGKKLF